MDLNAKGVLGLFLFVRKILDPPFNNGHINDWATRAFLHPRYLQTDFLHPQNSSDTFSFQKVKFPMI